MAPGFSGQLNGFESSFYVPLARLCEAAWTAPSGNASRRNQVEVIWLVVRVKDKGQESPRDSAILRASFCLPRPKTATRFCVLGREYDTTCDL